MLSVRQVLVQENTTNIIVHVDINSETRNSRRTVQFLCTWTVGRIFVLQTFTRHCSIHKIWSCPAVLGLCLGLSQKFMVLAVVLPQLYFGTGARSIAISSPMLYVHWAVLIQLWIVMQPAVKTRTESSCRRPARWTVVSLAACFCK